MKSKSYPLHTTVGIYRYTSASRNSDIWTKMMNMLSQMRGMYKSEMNDCRRDVCINSISKKKVEEKEPIRLNHYRLNRSKLDGRLSREKVTVRVPAGLVITFISRAWDSKSLNQILDWLHFSRSISQRHTTFLSRPVIKSSKPCLPSGVPSPSRIHSVCQTLLTPTLGPLREASHLYCLTMANPPGECGLFTFAETAVSENRGLVWFGSGRCEAKSRVKIGLENRASMWE